MNEWRPGAGSRLGIATVVLLVLASLAVGAQAQPELPSYLVEAGQEANADSRLVSVEPLANGDRVTEFYSDHRGGPGPETEVGLEEANESIAFLFRGPRDQVSLVLVHGEAGSGHPGGSAEFAFEPVLSGGSWVAEDGVGDRSSSTARWTWQGDEQAGGVYRGGVLEEGFSMNLTPQFEGGVEGWTFLSGEGELTTPVTVQERIPLDQTGRTALVGVDFSEAPGPSVLVTVGSILAGLGICRVRSRSAG